MQRTLSSLYRAAFTAYRVIRNLPFGVARFFLSEAPVNRFSLRLDQTPRRAVRSPRGERSQPHNLIRLRKHETENLADILNRGTCTDLSAVFQFLAFVTGMLASVAPELSRARCFFARPREPLTTRTTDRTSGYEGKELSKNVSPSLFCTSSRHRLHLQLSLSPDVP